MYKAEPQSDQTFKRGTNYLAEANTQDTATSPTPAQGRMKSVKERMEKLLHSHKEERNGKIRRQLRNTLIAPSGPCLVL